MIDLPVTRPAFDLPWLETMMRANLVRDWMKGATACADIIGRSGMRWTAAYLHFLARIAGAASSEERLRAQEAWLRSALDLCADCTGEIDRVALTTANKVAEDMARTLEVEAIASATAMP